MLTRQGQLLCVQSSPGLISALLVAIDNCGILAAI